MKLNKAKRIAAIAAAFAMSVGVFSGFAEEEEIPAAEPAESQNETGEENPPSTLDEAVKELEEQEQNGQEENGEASDGDTEEGGPEEELPGEDTEPGEEPSDDTPEEPSEEAEENPYSDDSTSGAFDVTPYAYRLKEISAEQEELARLLGDIEGEIELTEENKQLYIEYLTKIQDKIMLLNQYTARLEISMNDNKRLIDLKEQEIDRSIETFKKRLRALYLAGGDDSYISVVLTSNDFFDILMRMELVRRIAEYDDTLIDELAKSKQELLDIKSALDEKQSEYDTQIKALDEHKAMYDRLLAENSEVRKELEAEAERLKAQNDSYISERQAFELDLSGLLKSDYGDSAGDTARVAAELEASAALERLRANIASREEKGETLSDDECRYVFKWPVPGVYYISYGVGARWGKYHQGIDISGNKYDDIRASESGTVVKINTSCPHDYGKEESCGCGGGYGNYIIIDHGNGFLTLYGHLTQVDVQEGDRVKQGDHIGLMGSTGFSTGDHLHFEIRYNGMYVNPTAFVVIDS